MTLWALSGFSVLTLELVWMRELALWAGNTVIASTLVIAVFFSAAALGNLWGARLVGGRQNALACYWRFEIAAALSAVIMFALCHWLWGRADALPQGPGLQVLVALLLVGPTSFCSGVAFPSLAETFVPDAQHRTACGAPFYGLNLLGAALGVAAGGVWLPMWLGVSGAFGVAASLQLLGGLLAWRIAHRCQVQLREKRSQRSHTNRSARLGWFLLGASGVLSLAAQSLLILWVRQVLEGSVYAVCGVLGAFIGGLGLGALAAGALRRRGRAAKDLLVIFASASAALLFVLPVVGTALSVRDLALTADAPSGLLMQSLSWCALALLPLTLSLGGVFPLAWELAGAPSFSEGRVLGTALALNKLGAALGTAGALFVLMPFAGLARGTFVIAWGYVLVAVMAKRPSLRWLAALTVPGLWLTLRPMALPGITPDLRVVSSSSGAYGPVSVIEDRATGSRQILLNSRQRLSGTRAALSSQLHQSWVPLCFARKPDRVLTIGMAAGISAAAALDFPVKELTSVELVPEVVTAARDHFSEWNHALFTDPRSHVVIGDGRVTLAQMQGGFDAILCDLFFPSEEGTAYLYSRDFFQTARTRLNAGGVFCLWLPCYQLTPQTAGVIVRTFIDVFPNAVAVRSGFDPLQPVIGLLGSNDLIPMSRAHFAARLATPEGQALATRSPFFRSADNAMLMLVGDLRATDPGFDMFAMTTDDRPLFAFMGPRQPRGKERLFGFPFLDWIGRRLLSARYPSCDLADTPPEQMLNTVRAGHFYFAAASANVTLPGDTRPEALRQQQVQGHLARAQALAPALLSPLKTRGGD